MVVGLFWIYSGFCQSDHDQSDPVRVLTIRSDPIQSDLGFVNARRLVLTEDRNNYTLLGISFIFTI